MDDKRLSIVAKLRNILTHSPIVFLIALSLLAVSCGKDVVASIPLITFIANPVTSDAGSQYISVTSTASWTLSANYSGSQSKWLSFERTSGNTDNPDVLLSYTANTEEDDRESAIVIKSGNKSSRYSFVQRGKPTTVCGWMELPEIDESADPSKFAFFAHDMTVGSTRTRNYSFYWDYSDRVSLWVAYPLNAWNIGTSVGRSEAWAFDPLLPSGSQSDVSKGYQKGNDGIKYDRGHQIPSADRQGTRANNATTFYGTNITPQNNGFNGNLWASLENSVRNWAKSSDTLYVVTGCIVEGSTKYVTDVSDNKVTVPVAYFKALLRYKSSSAVGITESDYSACAFYFDHQEYSTSDKYTLPVSSGLSISIAELEEKLGYKLFVNLGGQIGERAARKIKEEDPALTSWWWDNK